MPQKTLLIVTSTFPRWSEDTVPSFVFDLALHLTSSYRVIVLAPHAKGAATHQIMKGVEIVRYRYFFDWGEELAYNGGILNNLKTTPIKFLLIPLLAAAQIFSLIRLLRTREIDIIHAHWSIPNGVCAALALKLLNVKTQLVCTLHGSDISLKTPFFAVMQRFVFKKSSAITAVSQYLFDQAIEIGAAPSKLKVISMGVEVERKFKPDPNIWQRKQLLFVGRLIKSKGVKVLLKAMAIVVSVYPEQQLVIVGDGPERTQLEALAVVLGISNNVIFVGAKSHDVLPQFYQQALIFISPTLEEGFGLTIAEAMSCECAVIASRVGAVSDLIVDQQTGLLFEAGNHQALAECILKVLKDDVLCERLMRAGRENVVNNFGWQHVASRYRMLFDTLLYN